MEKYEIHPRERQERANVIQSIYIIRRYDNDLIYPKYTWARMPSPNLLWPQFVPVVTVHIDNGNAVDEQKIILTPFW